MESEVIQEGSHSSMLSFIQQELFNHLVNGTNCVNIYKTLRSGTSSYDCVVFLSFLTLIHFSYLNGFHPHHPAEIHILVFITMTSYLSRPTILI